MNTVLFAALGPIDVASPVAQALQEAVERLGQHEVGVELLRLAGVPRLGLARLLAPQSVFVSRLVSGFSTAPVLNWLLAAALAKRVARLLRSKSPSVVVCLDPLALRAVRRGLANLGSAPALVAMITASPGPYATWLAAPADLYLVPDEASKAALLSKGIPEGRVAVSGLSLNPRWQTRERDRMRLLEELGLSADKPIVLLAGQSVAAICPVARAVSRARLPVQLVIACGDDELLRRRLQECVLAVRHRVAGANLDTERLLNVADVLIGRVGSQSVQPPDTKGITVPADSTYFACCDGACTTADDTQGLVSFLGRVIERGEIGRNGGFHLASLQAVDEVAARIVGLCRQGSPKPIGPSPASSLQT